MEHGSGRIERIFTDYQLKSVLILVLIHVLICLICDIRVLFHHFLFSEMEHRSGRIEWSCTDYQ